MDLPPAAGGGVARTLQEFLPELEHERAYLGASEGEWSLHELILHLFGRIGPASLRLSSWGLTEKPLKSILDLVLDGTAREPKLLLDHRVKLQSAAAYQLLLASGLDIRLAQNHSKVVVMRNADWGLSLVTSSNLTRNPRLEFYVVFSSLHLADSLAEWFDRVHANATPLT